MSPLDRDELARALSDGRWFDAASMIARLAPAPVPSLADGEWRDAPRAPASVPTPAIDPRRTVGAVVKTPDFDTEWVVVGEGRVRRIDSESGNATQILCTSDVFVRWATREECERHGIPYVDRTTPYYMEPGYSEPPASKPVPVDREGLAKAIRAAWWGDVTPSPAWDGMRPHERDEWMSAADAAIKFLGGASQTSSGASS